MGCCGIKKVNRYKGKIEKTQDVYSPKEESINDLVISIEPMNKRDSRNNEHSITIEKKKEWEKIKLEEKVDSDEEERIEKLDSNDLPPDDDLSLPVMYLSGLPGMPIHQPDTSYNNSNSFAESLYKFPEEIGGNTITEENIRRIDSSISEVIRKGFPKTCKGTESRSVFKRLNSISPSLRKHSMDVIAANILKKYKSGTYNASFEDKTMTKEEENVVYLINKVYTKAESGESRIVADRSQAFNEINMSTFLVNNTSMEERRKIESTMLEDAACNQFFIESVKEEIKEQSIEAPHFCL